MTSKKLAGSAHIPKGLINTNGEALIGDVAMGGGMPIAPLKPMEHKTQKVEKNILPEFQQYYDRIRSNENIVIPSLDFECVGTQFAFVLPISPKTTASGITIIGDLSKNHKKSLNRLPVLVVAVSNELHDKESSITTSIQVGDYVWLSRHVADQMSLFPLRAQITNPDTNLREEIELLIGVEDISYVRGRVQDRIYYFRQYCESRLDILMGLYKMQPVEGDYRAKFLAKNEAELELIANGCPYQENVEE